MAVNIIKIINNGVPYEPINLTDTTAVEGNVEQGKVFYKASGERGVGTSQAITPTGTLNITENNTYDVTDYAEVDVNVPMPSGTIQITENGTINVNDYEYADVNVQPNLGTVTATTNNQAYSASDYGYDGFSQVDVQVPESQPNLQNKSITITQNETVTYTADSGYDGLESLEVTTNVSSGGSGNPEGFISGGDINTVAVVTVLKFNEQSTSLDFTGIDTSGITTTRNMFANCSSLTTLNVSSFNTSNVTNMNCMFSWCTSLTSLNASSFNTSNVTNMGDMFNYCLALTSLNISNFNTNNVTYMSSMFNGCNSLTSLDLSSFNTSNVTAMGGMFNGCNSLTNLDLSNFNTSNVTEMNSMFSDCGLLQTLDIRNFDFTRVADYNGMFNNVPSTCTIYVNQAGYNWLADKYNNGNSIALASLSMLQIVGDVVLYTLQDGLYYYGNYFYVRFDTANQTFIGQNDTQSYSGTYTRSGNTLTLTYGAYSNTQTFIITSDTTIIRSGYIYTYQPEQ